MLNRVDNLLKEANESSLYIIEFGLAKSKGYEIFIGIEGDDQPYYSQIVRSKFKNKKIAFIRCGNRDNVLDYIEYLKKCDSQDNRDSIFCGFVDHDYDENFVPPYPDKTYVTPCYSYENFYTTITAFERLLEAKFHVKDFNEFSNDFETARLNYLERRDQFLNEIIDVECVVRTGYLMDKKRIRSLKKSHVSKLKLSKCTISVNCFSLGYTPTMQGWIDNLDDYVDINFYLEIRSRYESFNSEQLNHFIRGKIVFDFYIKYLTDLLKDESDKNSICFKTRNSIRKQNNECTSPNDYINLLNTSLKATDLVEATSNLAPFADIPDCLLDFLDRVIKEKLDLCA